MKFKALILALLDGYILFHAHAFDSTQAEGASVLLASSGLLVLGGLAFIWSADYFGEFSGTTMKGLAFDPATNFFVLVLFGWLLLCFPLAVLA
jgi:hypothetical protein